MEAINSSEVRNEIIILVEGSSQRQGWPTLHLWKAKSLAFQIGAGWAPDPDGKIWMKKSNVAAAVERRFLGYANRGLVSALTELSRLLSYYSRIHFQYDKKGKQNSGTSGTTILLYYIIGYMFRPIYRSSSGFLLQVSP